VCADKGYDAQEFIEACQQMKVRPHVAQNTSGRRSAVPDTIASSVGYAVSQQKGSSCRRAGRGGESREPGSVWHVTPEARGMRAAVHEAAAIASSIG
jgi:hypothetical protein